MATGMGRQSRPTPLQIHVQTCTEGQGPWDPEDPGSWDPGSWIPGSWGQDPGILGRGSGILGSGSWDPGIPGPRVGWPRGPSYGRWTLALSKHPPGAHPGTGYPGPRVTAPPGMPRPSACRGSLAVARTADPSPTRCPEDVGRCSGVHRHAGVVVGWTWCTLGTPRGTQGTPCTPTTTPSCRCTPRHRPTSAGHRVVLAVRDVAVDHWLSLARRGSSSSRPRYPRGRSSSSPRLPRWTSLDDYVETPHGIPCPGSHAALPLRLEVHVKRRLPPAPRRGREELLISIRDARIMGSPEGSHDAIGYSSPSTALGSLVDK